MPQLIPHILLRCQAGKISRAAVALRTGGYAVTKVESDSLLIVLTALGGSEAIVIDLPILAAVGAARELAEAAPTTPLLAISTSPAVLHNVHPSVRVLSPNEVDADIVRMTDRLLADDEATRIAIRASAAQGFQLPGRTFQKSRDGVLVGA